MEAGRYGHFQVPQEHTVDDFVAAGFLQGLHLRGHAGRQSAHCEAQILSPPDTALGVCIIPGLARHSPALKRCAALTHRPNSCLGQELGSSDTLPQFRNSQQSRSDAVGWIVGEWRPSQSPCFQGLEQALCGNTTATCANSPRLCHCPCLAVEGLRHFWWLPAEPASVKPLRRRIEITRSAVNRGVPRSPNRQLDQLRGGW